MRESKMEKKMKILFKGAFYGRSKAAYISRGIMSQLLNNKNYQVKLDSLRTKGYWADQGIYKRMGKEDLLIFNSKPSNIPENKVNKKVIFIVPNSEMIDEDDIRCLNAIAVSVWAISDYGKKNLIKKGVLRPINVIGIGINPELSTQQIRPCEFLNVSTLVKVEDKIVSTDSEGLKLLIRSFKEEFKDRTNVTLILKFNLFGCTNGDAVALVGGIAGKDNLSNIAIISDFVPNNQMNTLYNQVHCGVFPIIEGTDLCRSVLEMMDVGKIVIVSDHIMFESLQGSKIIHAEIGDNGELDYSSSDVQTEPIVTNSKHLKYVLGAVFRQYYKKRVSHNIRKDTWEHVGNKIDKLINKFNKIY